MELLPLKNSFIETDKWLKKQYNYNKKILKNKIFSDAILFYILHGPLLNRQLAFNKIDKDDYFYIKTLDTILSNAPKLEQDITVYRGNSVKFDFKRLSKTFTSTSLRKESALNFSSKKNGILIEFILKKGLRCICIFQYKTKFSHELEILLPRNVNYTIIEKGKNFFKIKVTN